MKKIAARDLKVGHCYLYEGLSWRQGSYILRIHTPYLAKWGDCNGGSAEIMWSSRGSKPTWDELTPPHIMRLWLLGDYYELSDEEIFMYQMGG